MIVLDTHIWIWWVQGDPRLGGPHAAALSAHEPTGLGVSAISCWEVAKLVEKARLALPTDIDRWLDTALAYPGVRLLELTPRISAEACRLTQLPGGFHNDPADQIIVATARVLGCALLTADAQVRSSSHVTLVA